MEVIGYKGFEKDLTCRGYQYTVGQVHTMDASCVRICLSGFHFCRFPLDVLQYYDYNRDSTIIYGRVVASGTIINDQFKSVSSELKITNILTYDQLLDACTGVLFSDDLNRVRQWFPSPSPFPDTMSLTKVLTDYTGLRYYVKGQHH